MQVNASVLITVQAIVIGLASLLGAELTEPKGWPKVKVTRVVIPTRESDPIQVLFDLEAIGKTPVGIRGDQLSIEFARPGWTVRGALGFTNGAPALLMAIPGRLLSTNATVAFGDQEKKDARAREWAPGEYTAQVFINSRRKREFPYQWLGQVSSDTYSFEVK